MKKIFAILILGLATTLCALAQTVTIKGKIVGSDGELLVGATALAPSGKYAVAETDGTFSLEVKKGDQISVSCFGYDDAKFTIVEGQLNYTITLPTAAATMLDETVVIGYGTTTKKEITGSVASLKSEDFDKGAYNDASGLLQGKVAGLTITNPNGADPNGNMEIILRGTNTLAAGQGPLIIIDGVSGADIKNIDFQEVESIDVLKDGSAAAIYGTRGTNGVIIITTKRAKAGTTSLEYQGQMTVQTIKSRATPLSASQFNEAITKYAPDRASSLYGAETDWFDEVTRTPFSHRHTLTLAGGSERFSHRTTANLEKNQGILKNNYRDRISIKTNIHQEAIKDWLTFDYNIGYNKRKFENTRSGIFRQAFLHNPTEPVYDANDTEHGGYYTIQSMDYYNPVAMLNERSSEYNVDNVLANARATLFIAPVKGLKWDNFVSYGFSRAEYNDYKTKYYPGSWSNKGTSEISNSNDQDLQFESTIQYQNSFGNHNLQAILGYTYEQKTYNESWMYNYDYDTDFFKTNNIGAGKALLTGNAEMSSYKSSSRYIAFFGRVMYNYDERYILSLSLRRDGSSRFGVNNKWGWFPAVSAGWRITREKWMKNAKWLDELKLRAGFGMTGNQDFDNYKSMFLVQTSGNFYYNGTWSTAYAPASNANPDLAWEKKSEFNVGLDFSVLKGRISGAIDYYYRLTSDLLYNYTVPVPPYDYGTMFTNVGKISNSGIELTLNAVPVQRKNFVWDMTITASHNENKLISFTNEEFAGQEYRTGWLNTPLGVYCQRLIEGESIGTFYGPNFIKISSSGGTKLEQMTENDWVKLGTAYPICNLGWSNSFKFYNFTITATIRSAIGGKVFNQMRAVYENMTELGLKNIMASWMDCTNFTGSVVYSDRYLEDATYVKLDNLTIAYDVPLKNCKVLKGLGFYLSGQNLITITGYTGVDPEVNLSGLTPGIEGLSYYPRTRAFTLGANIRF